MAGGVGLDGTVAVVATDCCLLSGCVCGCGELPNVGVARSKSSGLLQVEDPEDIDCIEACHGEVNVEFAVVGVGICGTCCSSTRNWITASRMRSE
jgi:hypothetical protein